MERGGTVTLAHEADTTIAGIQRSLDERGDAETARSNLEAIDPSALSGSTRVRWLRAHATAVNRLGESKIALAQLFEALDLAQPLPDRVMLVQVLRDLATVHLWRNQFRQAMSFLNWALCEAIVAAQQDLIAQVMWDLGRLHLELGHVEAAIRMTELGLKRFDGALDTYEFVRAKVSLVQAHVRAGNPSQAADALADVPHPLPRWLGFLVPLQQARIALLKGNLDEASCIARELEASLPDGEVFNRTALTLLRGEIDLAQGRNSEALESSNAVVSKAVVEDLPLWEILARRVQAKALDGLGRKAEADESMLAALHKARRHDLDYDGDGIQKELTVLSGRWAAVGASRAIPVARVQRPRFLVCERLGGGGTGEVFRGYDIELGRTVAIKRMALPPESQVVLRDDFLKTARREIANASLVHHPNIARVHGLDVESDTIVIASEFIPGPSLGAAIATPDARRHALAWLEQLAWGLEAIHKAGIIHGDLKPPNIMLRNGRTPVIIDFGSSLSCRIDPDMAPQSSSKGYVPPEFAPGKRTGPEQDIFAFGVIAFQLLCNAGRARVTFPAPQHHSVLGAILRTPSPETRALQDAGLDGPLLAAVLKCLAGSPHDRPNAATLCEAFSRTEDETPLH